MSMGIYYAIKHKTTGEFMPALEHNRGYSWWNPNNPRDPRLEKKILGVPRILKSLRQAKQVISRWNAMPNASYKGYINSRGEDDYGVDIEPDGRKKEDLEVVEIELRVSI